MEYISHVGDSDGQARTVERLCSADLFSLPKPGWDDRGHALRPWLRLNYAKSV